MQKYIVKSLSFNNTSGDYAYVSFVDTKYRVTLPKSHIFNTNGDFLLKSGDVFTVLYDYNGFDVAYIYNYHFYPCWITQSTRVLINNLILPDRLIYAHAVRREVRQMHKIPSLFAYKNLQKLLDNHFITTNKIK